MKINLCAFHARRVIAYLIVAWALASLSQGQDRPTPVATGAHQPLQLRGRVVDGEHAPVENARIYLAISDAWHELTHGYGDFQETPEFLGVSQSDGTFSVEVPARDIARGFPNGSMLVVAAPEESNLGVDWAPAYIFNVGDKVLLERALQDPEVAKKWEQMRVLQLSSDNVPIHGRIVGANGRPIAGLKLRVANIQQMQNDDLAGYLEIARRKNPTDYDEARNRYVTKSFFGERGRYYGLGDLITATTDEDGRFTLRGIGRNRVAWLSVAGAGERILVRTSEGQALTMLDGELEFTLHPAHFQYSLLQTIPIEGKVVDLDTGAPIPGVLIENETLFSRGRLIAQRSCWTRSNERGEFRLLGLPSAETIQLVASAQDSPHLPTIETLSLTKDPMPLKVELKLKRGVWIKGRVFNKESAEPIWCYVHYFAFRDNPHVLGLTGFRGSLTYPGFAPYITDINGTYKIPGLPGYGIVAVRTMTDPSGNRYPACHGQITIRGARSSGMWTSYDTLPSECRVAMYHGLKQVEPEASLNILSVNFPLIPSQTVFGNVHDPAGEQLRDFKYAGAKERDFFMRDVKGETFTVSDYEPSHPRRLLFWHEERQLAASVILSGELASPISVQLQPHGALSGRVIDETGNPLVGILLEVPPLLEPQPSTAICALPQPNYRTDKEGRFRIVGLAPGIKYNLVTRLSNGEFRHVVVDAIPLSGETTDLGDVTLVPLRVPDQE